MSQDQRFRELRVHDIEEFVRRREPETLHLEFKTVPDEELSSQPGRRAVAELVSGFANADGGVVVWGVDARRIDGVDCAQTLLPLKRARAFASRLHSLQPDATSPVVEGVDHRSLEYPDGAGFVVTHVPASEGGPHMAKFGEDRFLRRREDRIVRMEQFEVADMFGRRRRPVIEVVSTVAFDHREIVTRDIWRWAFRVVVGLANSGRGGARAPYLALHLEDPNSNVSLYGLTGNYEHGLPRLASAGMPEWVAFGAPMDVVIHPGTRHDVTAIRVLRPINFASLNGLHINFRATAEGIQLQEGSIDLSADELRTALPDNERSATA